MIFKHKFGKKAQGDIVRTAIYVAIGLVVVVLMVIIGVKVYQLSEPSQGSMVSFNRFTNAVNILVDNHDLRHCHIQISFEDTEVLVGFNRRASWVKTPGWWGLNNIEIARPETKCIPGKSCIALCDWGQWTHDDDCKGEGFLDHEIYKDVESFEYVYESGDPTELMYYGDAGTVELFSLEKIGTAGNYVIKVYNSNEKQWPNSQPCEKHEKVQEGLMDISKTGTA